MFESKCNDFRMQKLIVFFLTNIKSYDHSEIHGKKNIRILDRTNSVENMDKGLQCEDMKQDRKF